MNILSNSTKSNAQYNQAINSVRSIPKTVWLYILISENSNTAIVQDGGNIKDARWILINIVKWLTACLKFYQSFFKTDQRFRKWKWACCVDFIPWHEKAIFLFCSISCQIESKVNVASQSPRVRKKPLLKVTLWSWKRSHQPMQGGVDSARLNCTRRR